MSELLHGLAPIVGPDARILVLGNMPSAMSLVAREYYGNPRNAFWRITGEILEFDARAPYEERVQALHSQGVAVWDVLLSCCRIGSLDSAVERSSMVPNDFGEFFAGHSTVERVVFNGAAAEANYSRLVSAHPPVPGVRAPSTSPAHTICHQDKLEAWRVALGV